MPDIMGRIRPQIGDPTWQFPATRDSLGPYKKSYCEKRSGYIMRYREPSFSCRYLVSDSGEETFERCANWATPHVTALKAREFLTQTFGNRFIGSKHFANEWPAQSPDQRIATLATQALDYYSNQQMAVVHSCQGWAVEQIHKWASFVNVIDGSKSIFYLNLNINSLFLFWHTIISLSIVVNNELTIINNYYSC